MDREVLEGVALDVHRKHGFEDPPVDAFELTHELRMPVEWTNAEVAYRFERRLYIPRCAVRRSSRVHGLLTHEAAHVLLDDYAIEQSEKAARYLGAALLVPRRALDRELRAGWDLGVLMARHVNASAELLARRVTDVRHASLTIYDQGRFRYRCGHRDVKPANERELVDEVLATSCAVRVDDLTGAWPMFDGAHRRVLVLAAA